MADNQVVMQSKENEDFHGPQKIEIKNDNAYLNKNTNNISRIMKARKRYNELREKGVSHPEAKKQSGINELPYEEQIRILREVKQKNPSFFEEASNDNDLLVKSKNIDFWNIVYSEEEINKLKEKYS